MGAARISHPSGVTIILQTESHALQTADKEMLPQQAGGGGTEEREVEKTVERTESRRTEEEEQCAHGTRSQFRENVSSTATSLICLTAAAAALHLRPSPLPSTLIQSLHHRLLQRVGWGGVGRGAASLARGCSCVAHITTTGFLGSHTHKSTQDKRRTDRWEKRGGKKRIN